MTAINKAYASGTSFGIDNDHKSGNLTILSQAKSYAFAHYNDSDFTANGANLGIMEMNAKAGGIFEAYLDSTGANIYVKNITISLPYTSTSNAISTQPGGGIKVNGVSGDTNVARATSDTKATGGIKGSGHVYTGNLYILVNGSDSSATAVVDGKKVDVGAVKIGLNYAQANLSMTQNAYIMGDDTEGDETKGEGTVNADGSVQVLSKMNNAASTSKLGSNGGTNAGFVASGNQWADANAGMASS